MPFLRSKSAQLGMTHFPPFGWRAGNTFWGGGLYLRIQRDQRVLIPRPETEELVHWMLETLEQGIKSAGHRNGSGCIPVTLKNTVRVGTFGR